MAGGVSLLLSFILSSLLLLLLLQLAFLSQATSHFGFVKQLEGSQKGDKVEGIHKVKKYLQRFGYMKPANYQTEEASDDFDEELESAMKDFQKFYKLEPTGRLDAPTADLMSRPRCGVPDYPTATRTRPHDHGHLNIGSHYVLGDRKWPPELRNLIYYMSEGPHPEAGDPVEKAFEAWALVSGFTFQRYRVAAHAHLKVSFRAIDGPGGVLAYGTPPTEGIFVYDVDEKWVIGAVAEAYDLQTLATHEIGHLLGMGHSQSPDAVMYAYMNPGVVKGLSQDDIDGIRALYSG